MRKDWWSCWYWLNDRAQVALQRLQQENGRRGSPSPRSGTDLDTWAVLHLAVLRLKWQRKGYSRYCILCSVHVSNLGKRSKGVRLDSLSSLDRSDTLTSLNAMDHITWSHFSFSAARILIVVIHGLWKAEKRELRVFLSGNLSLTGRSFGEAAFLTEGHTPHRSFVFCHSVYGLWWLPPPSCLPIGGMINSLVFLGPPLSVLPFLQTFYCLCRAPFQVISRSRTTCLNLTSMEVQPDLDK